MRAVPRIGRPTCFDVSSLLLLLLPNAVQPLLHAETGT